MYGKNVQELFHIYFLIPCLMFLCFSRNNALTVYVAASVLMNYRSTLYGFRKSPPCGCESASFPFLGLSPKKRNEEPGSALLHKGHASLLTAALRALSPLFTSEATMAYKALLLNFLL